MRLIDADALIENIKRVYCTDCNSYGGVRCRACGTGDAMDMADDAPEIDAAPVVRCKDCVEYHQWFQECRYFQSTTAPDDYCSEGVRKDGEAE